jgi:predicted nucleic acid-binding Zn finger protein
MAERWAKVTPKDAKLPEKVKQADAEFAPGIPKAKTIHPIPENKKPTLWQFVVQHHPAAKSGDHLDLRLVDNAGLAHSWATKKELPKPGGITRIFQQPTHSAHYALNFQGPILGGGYGATRPGTEVKQVVNEKADVLQSDDKLIRFNTYGKGGPQEFLMTRAAVSGGPHPSWNLLNITKSKEGLKIPFSKPMYKETRPGAIDLSDDAQVMAAKINGAHNTFLLEAGKRPRIFSYREPRERTTGAIEHSQKLQDLYNNRIPKELHDTVLRGEVYARTLDGNAPVPAETVGGMLNAGIWKSRELQAQHGKLRSAIFDVVKFKGKDMSQAGYDEKLLALREVSAKMPGFEIPEMAINKEEKEALLEAIKTKMHPATHEGVVLWHRHEAQPPIKAKFKDEHDVHVRNIFQAVDKNGQPKNEAGGFDYSHTPDGPVVGRVGTGFSREMKEDMHKRPHVYQGAVARIAAMSKYKSGALEKPSFQGWHVDKNEPKFWQQEPIKKEASVPDILFHGSPQDLLELKAPDKKTGIFLTTQPGLAAPFIVGREEVTDTHGKIRLGQRTWEELPPGDMTIPKNIVILYSGKVEKEKGTSKGFIYAVDSKNTKDKLKVSPDEPREMIYHGDTLPIVSKVPVTLNWTTEKIRLDNRKTTKQAVAPLSTFLSKEKRKALKDVDTHFLATGPQRWESFTDQVHRKSFVQALQKDPRADEKLKRHVDQMNRLKTGKVIAEVPGSAGSYKIVQKRGGGLGCTCPDWRYKKSVAPEGEQDCKHIKAHRANEMAMKKVSEVEEAYAAALEKLARFSDTMEIIDSAVSNAIVGRITGGLISGGDPKAVAAGAATGAATGPALGMPAFKLGKKMGLPNVGKTLAKYTTLPLSAGVSKYVSRVPKISTKKVRR